MEEQFRETCAMLLRPAKILSEQDKTTSILRDLLNEDFNRIVTNDKNIYNDTRNYIQKICAGKGRDIVSHHKWYSYLRSIWCNKASQISFGKTVNLPSGAYLIVEHTEALHVIDVNSGYKSVSNNQEENALKPILKLLKKLHASLRLRDIGGIIVVDFIDMKLPENKRKVQDAMEEFMQADGQNMRYWLFPSLA